MLRNGANSFRHLVGAADDQIPVLFGCIEEDRFPLGRIITDFENLGLDVVAILVLDHLHAIGSGIEEGFIAERAIDDEQDLVLSLSCRGGNCAHRRGSGESESKMKHSPSGELEHNRTPFLHQ